VRLAKRLRDRCARPEPGRTERIGRNVSGAFNRRRSAGSDKHTEFITHF